MSRIANGPDSVRRSGQRVGRPRSNSLISLLIVAVCFADFRKLGALDGLIKFLTSLHAIPLGLLLIVQVMLSV